MKEKRGEKFSAHSPQSPQERMFLQMQYKKIDIAPYSALFEQQTGKPLPREAQQFLAEFAKQAATFQNWGAWDRRSGFDPLSYEEVLRHTETYLTGPRTLYNGTLPAFSEHLAHALTGFYLLGYEAAATDAYSEKENEASCLDQAKTM